MKKYSIIKKIGAGGMGEIYLARDNALNRDVAIKKLIIDSEKHINDQELGEIKHRFRQEAQAAARLNHPNIITIYHVGKSKTGDYIAMELLSGRSLEEWLKIGRKFTISETVKIGLQICEALHYAHNKGVVHRDIKPDNIFLIDDLKVKISDFGVAHIETDVLMKTRAGQFLGTPMYGSPEQWQDTTSVDGRADIYSLGVVLYRLLTGVHPFPASNINDLIYAIIHNSPASIRELSPNASVELEYSVMKAIRKNPDKRPQTGREFAELLKTTAESGKDLKNGMNRFGRKTTETAVDSTMDPALSALAEEHTILLNGLDFKNLNWINAILESWVVKEIGKGKIDQILDRILGVPIYTDPFSGVLLIDNNLMLLIWKGIILQALNLKTGKVGEKVFLTFSGPERHFKIYMPDNKSIADVPLVLSTILGKHIIVHNDVDSTIIDFSGLIQKLIKEKFTGIVRFRYSPGVLYFGFYSGSRLFILQSKHLNMDLSNTIVTNLTRAVQSNLFKVDVLETRLVPLRGSIRRLFSDATFSITHHPDKGILHSDMIDKKQKDYHPNSRQMLSRGIELNIASGKFMDIQLGGHLIPAEEFICQDFPYRFTNWFLFELFVHLLSSGNRDTMKYICTWIPEIDTVKLYTTLKSEDGQEQYFDIVTMDKTGKILHLIYLGAAGEKPQIKKFLDIVTFVKKQYIKSGGIGGVFYVSPEKFSNEALSYFHEMTAEKKKQFGLGYIDPFTGFKGFIRVGKNRGFHFNLVTELSRNDFKLIAPVL